MKRIILASTSPRRKELMEKSGLPFEIATGGYEEDMSLPLSPKRLAKHLSQGKARAVAPGFSNAIIIAADTFIVYQDRLLGKPHTTVKAREMLSLLSGKAHSVITGFTIIDTASGKTVSRTEETRVYFRKLDKTDIARYIRTKEPLDKAGAYAIQGLGAVFVKKIEGDYCNVMGFPLCAIVEILKREFGIKFL